MTYCEDLNKVLIRIRIRIFFFFNLIFPVQTRYKFSRRVKNAARLGVADETSRGLFVFFQRAFLAEVVFAPATSKRFSISVNFKFCRLPLIGAKFKTIRLGTHGRDLLSDDWICKAVSANHTFERQILVVRVNFIFFIVVVFFPIFAFRPLPLQLPTMLVVAPVVQKFAAIPKTAETCFFVIFTDVRLVVPSHCGAQICRGSYGPFSH